MRLTVELKIWVTTEEPEKQVSLEQVLSIQAKLVGALIRFRPRTRKRGPEVYGRQGAIVRMMLEEVEAE